MWWLLMKKLGVLALQQREHSSCPLLGCLLFPPPSLHSPLPSRSLPWTCQQRLRDMALISTASRSLRQRSGDRRHINKTLCFL